MSCAHSVARSASRSCARAVNARWGASFPASLAIAWPKALTAAGVLKCLKGDPPTFSGTPTVTADGVTPGDGPMWEGWSPDTSGGWTRVMRFPMDTASADLVGDVEIGGGFYAYSGGMKFKDGTNVATCATSWEEDEVVTVVVTIYDDGVRDLMRVQRGEDM